jgi:hypothetical protein
LHAIMTEKDSRRIFYFMTFVPFLLTPNSLFSTVASLINRYTAG